MNVLGKYYSPCKFFRLSQLVPVMCQIVHGSFVDVQGQSMPVKCLKSLLGEEAKLEQFTSLKAVSVLGNQLPSGKLQVALSL